MTRCLWRLASHLVLLPVLALFGCGDPAPAGNDGGGDSVSTTDRSSDGDGIDGPSTPDTITRGGCEGLSEALCRGDAACTYLDDCVTACDQPPSGSCYPAGTARRCEAPPDCEGSCDAARACGGEKFCRPPGSPPSCGVPTVNACEDHDGCPADQACEPEGSCGERICVPGCTGDQDCGVGEQCEASHCGPQDCSTSACPPNFECLEGGIGSRCSRLTCQQNGDCSDGGYCVLGQCFEEPGFCEMPAA